MSCPSRKNTTFRSISSAPATVGLYSKMVFPSPNHPVTSPTIFLLVAFIVAAQRELPHSMRSTDTFPELAFTCSMNTCSIGRAQASSLVSCFHTSCVRSSSGGTWSSFLGRAVAGISALLGGSAFSTIGDSSRVGRMRSRRRCLASTASTTLCTSASVSGSAGLDACTTGADLGASRLQVIQASGTMTSMIPAPNSESLPTFVPNPRWRLPRPRPLR
jgi:hypothetical protein